MYDTLLLAVTIGGKDTAIVALLGVVGALGAGWLFRKDTAIEERRRKAAELAGDLRELGLPQLGDVMLDYAVGDYSGVLASIRALSNALKSQGALPLLSKMFFAQLPQRLATPGDREKILQAAETALREGGEGKILEALDALKRSIEERKAEDGTPAPPVTV